MTEKKKIKWLEWGRKAFEKAKREDKPVLLDIHGTWCHWCHVMENTTYSDENIIKKINEKFVPVRVDTDKRPDINERYNQGGWPTTAFLTPSGRLIAGATYVPPSQMPYVLERAEEFYKENKSELETAQLKMQEPSATAAFDAAAVSTEVTDALIESFDFSNGGFGYEPKFPMPDAVDFALLLFMKHKDKKMLRLATTALDGMLGIFDGVAGGFFRYAVRHDWTQPHYEKMLETNAGLLRNYAYAYAITKNEKYRNIAERTASYMLAALSGKYFFGSQDADGEEEYYGKGAEERAKMPAPRVDRTLYVNLNAIAISAMLEAGAMLEKKEYQENAFAALDFILAKCVSENGACHYYSGRPQLYGLAADNIHLLGAFLAAWMHTQDKNYLEAAEKIADYLLEKHAAETGGFYDIAHSEHLGNLVLRLKNFSDNSAAAEHLAKLAIATKKEKYRETAEKTLAAFAGAYKSYSFHASRYAIATETLRDTVQLFVVGMPLEGALRYPDVRKVVIADERAKEEGYTQPGYYLCAAKTCKRFATAEELYPKLA